ncbi:MAG: polysaccharide pyruvyl transferase family protein [Acidobacteria bacterium]|nr:polysaccharide pyruvyl transferase family protein [Acidobacteriota bacterium]
MWRAAVEAWIPSGSDVAIIDVPVHRNVGDLFILAATRWLLGEMGCRLVYAAGARDYRAAAARRAISPRTVIVGLGGGNFGDLYPRYQTLREEVVADFPEHRIVVLPQTIHFRERRAFERSAAHLRRHRDLRIAARDAASLELARQITPHAVLMGDIVDVLGPAVLERAARARPDAARRGLLSADGTLVLLRRDAERSAAREGRRGVDWADLFPGFNARLAMTAALMPVAPGRLSAHLHERWGSLATLMLLDAVAIVRQARRVVTDRLHGAIVARLAGRPVTLVDNSYGKLAAYRDAWWRDDASIAVERRTDL